MTPHRRAHRLVVQAGIQIEITGPKEVNCEFESKFDFALSYRC